MTTDAVLKEVAAERERQHALWDGKHRWGEGDCSADLPFGVKLAVLFEEVGEVARAVLDKSEGGLRTELIQVAAVAVAWAEVRMAR